ncbi:TATA box-binding protein-associated factor RNA polymerase I subunit B [Thalassophryne amazonica]|uniref:TATA box-binding protein-associated factor RNA polymerase I subunit B n=1 Tax=Thalassophryne amazonica TaxID=390379 RepID=UPI00147220DA|nr:TATA box-binding protein-associated factor RNA polymerase I subunit B [Thalassophryne amazonica]
MDDEETGGFREACAQCSAVDWGVSDGGCFYCKSCHNVIERIREVVEPTFTKSSQVSTVGRGSRNKGSESGCQWMVCEGFQVILRNQADALLRLGVCSQFKDEVLCPLWRLYLQKSQQAYTTKPVWTSAFTLQRLDSDNTLEVPVVSTSDTDADRNPLSTSSFNTDSCSGWSQLSGSMDSFSYVTGRQKQRRFLMSMQKTLALLHLALVWCREALTLSDLLRLVNEGHVPYVRACEDLPEGMKPKGNDVHIFRVQKIPSHKAVHQEAQALAVFLQLPAFPPVSQQSALHPAMLSLRYLIDANLPDELHVWVCRVMELARLEHQASQMLDCSSQTVLPQYDVQTAALIVITMKFLFGLDDHTEWNLSNDAGDQLDPGGVFNLRRWYRLLQAALLRAQQRKDEDSARKQWVTQQPLAVTRHDERIGIKKKRVSEQLQICFEQLSSRPAGVSHSSPSSFRFCWGDQDGADGPSMHHKRLDGAITRKRNILVPVNSDYWCSGLRCYRPKTCRSHYSELEPTLPRMFVWLLKLFSFMLDVTPAQLYEEVERVERAALRTRPPRPGAKRAAGRTRRRHSYEDVRGPKNKKRL